MNNTIINYPIIIPIIGYKNLYINEKDLSNSFDDQIALESRLPLEILLIAGEKNVEEINELVKIFIDKYLVPIFDNLFYVGDYNKVSNNIIKNTLKYWRAKELEKLQNVGNDNIVITEFDRISNKFGSPKDFPLLNIPYILDENLQNLAYKQLVNKDVKIIKKFIEDEVKIINIIDKHEYAKLN